MTRFIASQSNTKIKKISSLKYKKYRKLYGLALIEGIKIIDEAISEGVEFDYILVDRERKEKYEYLKNKLECEFLYAQSFIIKSLSSTNTNQGIIAVIKIKERELTDICGDFLILDNIQDPGNLGAILRSGVASGYNQIYCINCVDSYNDKVIRSSMGAIFKCNIYNVKIEEIHSTLIKKRNYSLILADTKGESLFKFKLTKKTDIGIIIGNEGNGVSDKVSRLATHRITIPMKGRIESLNAAVSASIIMYNLKKEDF